MRMCVRVAWTLMLLVCVGGNSFAQTKVTTTDRLLVGSTDITQVPLNDVLRIIGSGTVSTGSATMRPTVLDGDGDLLRDTNTSVTTGGAYTWGGGGQFSSTLGVTGNTTLTGDLIGGTGTLLIASPTRISTTSPTLRFHESDAGTDEKYTQWLVDNDELSLDLISDALGTRNSLFRTQRTGLVPGDWRWGALLGNVRPENNGTTSLGSILKKYLTVHAWELWIQTLVAQETIATIGGRIFVAPTTKLVLDLEDSHLCMSVEHNQIRSGDTVLLQKDGRFEKILIGTNAIDCTVAGNCAVVFTGYNYCSLTRNRDGTGANDWTAGDAVLNEGNVGDGYIDIFADRSATSEGYVGMVVSQGPVAYWRMNESPSGQTIDLMGNAPNAVETGPQSNGLGVLSSLLGAAGSDPVWQNTNAGGYLLVANDSDLQITGDLTIEFWAFWENGGGADNIISRGGNGEFHLQVDPNGSLVFCNGNGAATECESTAAGVVPTAGDYHHYAVVRDATSVPKRVLFYKDGVLLTTSTYTQAVTAQALSTAIGENPSALGNPFDGNLDEVAIYNYQVPSDRLLLHFQARGNTQISKFTIGPTLCGNVRTGTGAFDVAERWCLGNLAGTYGYATPTAVYGFASGNPSATWISADATNGFRIMSGTTEKLKFDVSGNGYLTGDLNIAADGQLIMGSGSPTCVAGVGTGILLVGGTNPALCMQEANSYLFFTTGGVLSLKSQTFRIEGTGGTFVTAKTNSTFSQSNGYNFDSALAGTDPSLWAYEAAGDRRVRLDNFVTQSGTTAGISFAVNDEDDDSVAVHLTTGTAAAGDANINFIVPGNGFRVNGNIGTIATLTCSAGQAVKNITVRSGIVTAVSCGAP